MTIPPQLFEIIRQQLNAFPVWPPVNGKFSLGDYGIVEGEKFNRIGNTMDFGKDFTWKTVNAGSFQYMSPGTTLAKFVGDVKVDDIPRASKDARVEIEFKKADSIFLYAPVIKVSSITNLNEFRKKLSAIENRRDDWKFIVELYEAEDLLLITTNNANAQLSFTGDASSLQELKLRAHRITLKPGKGIHHHTNEAMGVIALGLMEMKKVMFGGHKNQPNLGMNSPNKNIIDRNEVLLNRPDILDDVDEDHSKHHPFEMVTEEKSMPPRGAELPMAPQLPGASAPEENKEAGPVQLGASAPGRVRPKQEFTARFIAYIKEVETEMKQKLQDLSPTATHHMGIKECIWQKGTKVKVRLSGTDLTVDPAEDVFTWNGSSQIVDFDVTVADLKEPSQTVLKFDVSIDNFNVARLRVDLEINDKPGEEKRQEVTTTPIRTAFASYASQDRLRVLDRVSEIVRNGVDVFMDCMSMRPGEKWEPRLEKEIKERDSFLLFWSANAVKSKWVNLEWKTALKERGIDRIEPHPLEPPNLAPPPDELKELHFNDIYIIARKANEG